MNSTKPYEDYDVAIIGGGLAGLALSILCGRAGYKTLLYEKERYPFHKVCGEYISFESWNFIQSLGLDLSSLNLPVIKKLIISSPSGRFLSSPLDLGGFGISRYFLDSELKNISEAEGVTVCDGVKVEEVIFKEESFTLFYGGNQVNAKIVAGCFGKRSNLDVKWKRPFSLKKQGKLNNYLGIKYHIKTSFPADTIVLHNFKDGYCGMSKIEDDRYCLCYLTKAQNLKTGNNSIKEMEQRVLQKNPFLKRIFNQSEFLFNSPVTISQISFDKKSPVENHILMLGDAAGMITPLCGNGMSMALHSAKIAFGHADLYLKNKSDRKAMEKGYSKEWKRNFSTRMLTGRGIQCFFGSEILTEFFIFIFQHFPRLTKKIIKSTHGKEF